MAANTQDRDEMFLEIALERGFLEEEQATACREDKAQLTKMGYPQSLMQIAIKKEFVTKSQVREIRREMQKRGVLPQFGGYELIAKLGQGGMGEVYKARQVSLDRIVALKMLAPELARDKSYVERFRREGLMAARITHPNAVQVFDMGEASKRHYMAMEFVEGYSADRLVSKGVSERKALDIAKGVLGALQMAHKLGIVHRDIKPANILIDKEGNPKLADLGIARQTGIAGITLTQSGAAIGTPYYMSPEQCRGDKDIDGRADIYSLGATLFHLLCGKPPFHHSKSSTAMIQSHLTEPPPDARELNPAVSQGLADLLKRMMAKDKKDRPQDCAAVLETIEELAKTASQAPADSAATPAPFFTRTPAPKTSSSSSASWASVVATPAVALATRLRQRRKAVAVVGLFAVALGSVALLGVVLGRRANSQDADAVGAEASDTQAAFAAKWQEAEGLAAQGDWREALAAWENCQELAEAMDEPPSRLGELGPRIARAEYETKRQEAARLEREDKLEEALPVWKELQQSGAGLSPPPPSFGDIPQRIASLEDRLQPGQAPPGFRPAEGTRKEPYSDSGWAREIVHGQTGISLLFVPAGEFLMGSPPEVARGRVEPQSEVRIERPFYMAKHPVTQGQWRSLMGNNPSARKSDERLPVENVSWNDAQAFVQKAGDGMRLPTEAEWEYACRAGSGAAYHFGDDESLLGDYGWHRGNSEGESQPVAQKAPNDWGLYDMHGNVLEWCQSLYKETPYDPADGREDLDADGPRVLRGGAFNTGPRACRSAYRQHFALDARRNTFGFRVVVPVPAEGE